jgi:uncharacterized protein (DUF4415 family)
MLDGLYHSGKREKVSKNNIKRYSLETINKMQNDGASKTDWSKAGEMTDEDLEVSIASDADEAGIDFDWSKASPHLHKPKAVLHMRVDKEVLDYFRDQGKGYQTKINSVLLSYIRAQKKTA